MNEYELVFVTKTGDSQTKQETLDEVKKTISDAKGDLVSTNDWGKKEFAYKVKKESNGEYTQVNFKSDSQVPGKINNLLKLNEELLRYLLVSKEESKNVG